MSWRRVRAILVLTMFWTFAAMIIGAAGLLFSDRALLNSWSVFAWDLTLGALFGGIIGITTGLIFTTLFMVLERGRSFTQLSIPRAAAWGALTSGVLVLMIAPSLRRNIPGETFLHTFLVGIGTWAPITSAAAVAVLLVARRGKVLEGSAEDVAQLTRSSGDSSA